MIITLTTDFGLSDHYVAAMKAALLRHCPAATLIDITHLIPPQDVLAGSISLERAVVSFDPGTVHLAVIDPGVGTTRRLLVARVNGSHVVCPDNGLITWTARRHPPVETFELLWRPPTPSATFHGRDILAPAAGMLAAGTSLEQLTRPLATPVLLELHLATQLRDVVVIHVDHYGNATTNLPVELLPADAAVTVGDHPIGPVRRTYQDVPSGSALALVGSSGLLEIAMRDGSASTRLNLRVGDSVTLA